MAVGAVQRLLQVHRVIPGRTAVVVGADALAVITARQLALAGVTVRGVVLPPREAPGVPTPEQSVQDLARFSGLGPSGLLSMIGRFVRPGAGAAIAVHGFPRDGVNVWDVPLMLRRAARRVVGDEVVRGIEIVDVDPAGTPAGRTETWEVDTVVLSGGLMPLCELALVIGCCAAHVPDLVNAITGPDPAVALEAVKRVHRGKHHRRRGGGRGGRPGSIGGHGRGGVARSARAGGGGFATRRGTRGRRRSTAAGAAVSAEHRGGARTYGRVVAGGAFGSRGSRRR
jgi:hypothetical protein